MDSVQGIVVGSTGTGSGESAVADGSTEHVLTTPSGKPNIVAVVITPIVAIAVSAVAVFFATLVATLSAGGLTDIIEFSSFSDLVQKGAIVAGMAAIFDVLKNSATFFTNLREKFPLLQV